MNVNIINPFQGLQNAYRPSGGKTSNANYGSVASSGEGNAGISSGEMISVQGQSLSIAASISTLQGQLSDLNVVHDPPFFPIATYQRVDLISQTRVIQEKIGQSSLPPELKQAVSDKLKNNATDKELGDAIGKLFAIRNAMTKTRTVAAKNSGSGSILTVKA